jgi:hypothetical protein
MYPPSMNERIRDKCLRNFDLGQETADILTFLEKKTYSLAGAPINRLSADYTDFRRFF